MNASLFESRQHSRKVPGGAGILELICKCHVLVLRIWDTFESILECLHFLRVSVFVNILQMNGC